MNNQPNVSSIKQNLSRILSAAKNFRHADNASTGMIFTDNWYDSHPRLLIFDPVLNPYDKLVWLAIRSRCTPDMSLTSFPSYDEIQSLLSISRGTVSSSIAKLRMTRWLTLLCRDQERNASGQFTRVGNIYMVHGEPLAISDTLELDANYMTYVHESTKHRSNDVRKIAQIIIGSFRHEINKDQNLLEYRHPFERRAEAWQSIEGEDEAGFFGTYPNLNETEGSKQKPRQPDHIQHAASTVVHDVNYGATAHDANDDRACSVRRDSVVRSSSKEVVKKYNYKKTTNAMNGDLDSQLVFPQDISENQKHLIELILLRLPTTLPPPPAPWDCWHQLLLDELDGRIRAGLQDKCTPVWNPVSLMTTYCKRLANHGIGLREDGKFQIENAEQICIQRSERAKQKKVYEDTRERYRRRTLEEAMNLQSRKRAADNAEL